MENMKKEIEALWQRIEDLEKAADRSITDIYKKQKKLEKFVDDRIWRHEDNKLRKTHFLEQEYKGYKIYMSVKKGVWSANIRDCDIPVEIASDNHYGECLRGAWHYIDDAIATERTTPHDAGVKELLISELTDLYEIAISNSDADYIMDLPVKDIIHIITKTEFYRNVSYYFNRDENKFLPLIEERKEN